jgi:hypothetical protein
MNKYRKTHRFNFSYDYFLKLFSNSHFSNDLRKDLHPILSPNVSRRHSSLKK